MKETVKKAIVLLDLPVLLFPVYVIGLVALGFVFRLPCTVWTWWAAVVLAVATAVVRRRESSVAVLATTVVLFAGLLFLVWLGSNLLTTSGAYDSLICYQPMVRLMAEGWNPVWQGTPEGMQAATGIAADEVASLHIFSASKGIFYFCTAAYRFTGAHFNLFLPLAPFLLISLLFAIADAFSHRGKLAVACAGVGELYFLPCGYDMIDNLAIAISGIGLLVTMARYLKSGQCHVPRLIAFSFLMMTTKPTGMAHCLVFWILFLIAAVWTKRGLNLWRCIRNGGILLILVGLVNVSPYVTSAVNFGSPFYPRVSGNPEKYPVKNITGDFLERNEDAAQMGHIGAFANAFLSSAITRKYYSLKTGKADFCPQGSTWGYCIGGTFGMANSKGAPTNVAFRFLYCSSLVLLLVFGGVAGRFIAACLVCAPLAMPTEMIGYSRYTPWVLSGFVLGVVAMTDFWNCRFRRSVQLLLLVVFAMAVAVEFLMFLAVKVDQRHAITQSLSADPPKVINASFHTLRGKYAGGETNACGNVMLLCRRVPALANAQIVVNPIGTIDAPETLQYFYDYSFKVWPEYDLERFSPLRKIVKLKDRKKRMALYPGCILKTVFWTLPKNFVTLVSGRFKP